MNASLVSSVVISLSCVLRKTAILSIHSGFLAVRQTYGRVRAHKGRRMKQRSFAGNKTQTRLHFDVTVLAGMRRENNVIVCKGRQRK